MSSNAAPKRRKFGKGFTQAGGLAKADIRKAGHTRGFAEVRVLTHWASVVGAEIAGMTAPKAVSYPRGSFGGTLTVITTGSNAPLVQLQRDQIRERVNACYGYNAISRVRIEQGALTQELAEPTTPFHDDRAETKAKAMRAKLPSLDNVKDENLRAALDSLGSAVIERSKSGFVSKV